MIPIVKPAAPALLLGRGAAAAQQHRADYEAAPHEYRSGARAFDFDASLYAAAEVKDALRTAQNTKCAFCESIFAHVGYGDVEHFRPKAGHKQREADTLKRPGYYWLAYAWDNLFYSCQLCNQRFKRNLFPLKDGRRRARSHKYDLSKEEPLLIDPSRTSPATYIGFRGEYAHAVGGCREGDTTIEVLGLNREELVEARRDRLASLKVLVQLIGLLQEKVATSPSPAVADQLRELEKRLQARQGAASEYAAMTRAYLASVST
jgi:uncharacterized protein (TIGR02646 family)